MYAYLITRGNVRHVRVFHRDAVGNKDMTEWTYDPSFSEASREDVRKELAEGLAQLQERSESSVAGAKLRRKLGVRDAN